MDEQFVLKLMSYGMMVSYLGVFYYLVFGKNKAPYGRYHKVEHFGNSIQFDFSAKAGWFIQECPAFLVPFYLSVFSDGKEFGYINKILLSMFMLHYFQRTFFYSLQIRGGKPSPWIVVLAAFVFCCYNGYLQGRYFTQYAHYSPDWTSTWQFQIGTLIFVVGMVINIHSDHVLRNLRKPGETGYKIPRGGMFEYVSGANFLGEMMEWVGYAVASCSLPAVAFAVATILNTGPRAVNHHQWYLEKFGSEYPRSRKALVPFIL